MDDLKHTPLYSIPECARYLGLPVSTVRGWIALDGSDPTSDSLRPVRPAGSNPIALSFTNLLEIFVLSSLRRNNQTPTRQLLETALSAKNEGQPLDPGISLEATPCLKRIEYDDNGCPKCFYPFTRGFGREDPKLVVIDPAVKFGRPVLAGTGVRTEVIARRIKVGEPFPEIADDYLLSLHQVEEAVRYELAF